MAIIDIGSDQVSGALFLSGQKEKTNISSNFRIFEQINLPSRLSVNFKVYIKDVTEALDKVLRKLASYEQKPQAVFCFLSSPYFVAQTKDIVWQAEKKKNISEKFIKSLIDQASEDFAAVNSSLYPEILDDQTIAIENETMKIALDGYVSGLSANKTVNKVEISQFISLGSRSLLGHFKNLINGYFPKATLKFQTFSFAAYSIFKDLIGPKEDFLLIDTAGDITDILVICDGVLAEHRTFPFGRRQVLKKMTAMAGTVSSEATTLLNSINDENANAVLRARAEKALEPVFAEWSSHFRKALEQIAETVFVPTRAYLVGNSESDKLFKKWIGETNLSDLLLSTENQLSVGFIEKKIFTYETINSPGQITNTFILVEALFCDKMATKLKSFYFINSLKNMQDIIKNKKSLREIFPEVGNFKNKPSGSLNVPPIQNMNSTIPSQPPRRSFRWGGVIVFLVIVCLVLIGGFTISKTMAKVTLKIEPKQQELDISTVNTATKEGAEGLKFVLAESAEEVQTESVTVTGSEKVSIKASGRIVILNNFSAESQQLVKNTRFQAPNGNIYRITESVTVPGTHKNEKGETEPGQLEVTVYADKAGNEYDLDLVDFTIPGFAKTSKFEKITAKSKTPIAGGFVGTRPKISDDDKARIEETMGSQLKSKMIEKLKQQVPEDYILFDDAVLSRFSLEMGTSTTASDSNKVSVTGKIIATGILFNREELSRFLAKALPDWQTEEDIRISNLDDLNFSLLDKGNLNSDSLNSISFDLKGKGKFVWQIDEEALKTELQKTESGSYNNVFGNYPQIQKATIVFRPPWIRNMPQNKDKITVEIVGEEETPS